jgi:hypothetical protein
MTRKEWEKIKEAAELLGLGEKASLAEIKKAYRNLSKKYHPDLKSDPQENTEKGLMQNLTEAYQLLLGYCTEFRFPLVPGEGEKFEAEDWWFERFGGDHHWGKGAAPDEEKKE